jgi:hypothetical protein
VTADTDIALNPGELDAFYKKYFHYYSTLNPYWQKVFIGRCLSFITEKIIIGAEGFKPNNMVKALISASAVQLTLGLETWKLNYFDTIIIHPRDFDDKASGLRFKGETNLAGYVRLSWHSFIAGYRLHDNTNLGLHEFTHALRFNPIIGFEQDYFFEHYFNSWLASAQEAYNDIRQNKKTIFRKYGGTNINEFLSVCIEHFFESPQEIMSQYPLLYYSTAILLNQRTDGQRTELNVRQQLFEEKNSLLHMHSVQEINTRLVNTNSFKIMLVVLVPWIYTIFATGIFSGATLVLTLMFLGAYLRYDFYFVRTHIENNHVYLRKGFFIFRNRRKLTLRLSQLISFHLYGNGTTETECDLIYYDLESNYFYSDNIPTGENFSTNFLNDIWQNKIAVFKS